MALPQQKIRTFFITFATSQRRQLFRAGELATLLGDVINDNRSKQRLQVHEFVIMPDHVHLILTPAFQVSLEKAVQFIKGGFSFRAKRELHFRDEIWQKSFNEHRIADALDYARHAQYIRMNPVTAGLSKRPDDYAYSSASRKDEVDPAPAQFVRSAAAQA